MSDEKVIFYFKCRICGEYFKCILHMLCKTLYQINNNFLELKNNECVCDKCSYNNYSCKSMKISKIEYVANIM